MQLDLPVLENSDSHSATPTGRTAAAQMKQQGWGDLQEQEADRKEHVSPHKRPLWTEHLMEPAGKAEMRFAGSQSQLHKVECRRVGLEMRDSLLRYKRI